jgi:hypothetical protein
MLPLGNISGAENVKSATAWVTLDIWREGRIARHDGGQSLQSAALTVVCGADSIACIGIIPEGGAVAIITIALDCSIALVLVPGMERERNAAKLCSVVAGDTASDKLGEIVSIGHCIVPIHECLKLNAM